MKRQRRALGAFTLIEMIVALLIIGTLAGVATVTIDAISSAHIKEDAGRLASVIRACYALAALNGRTVRLQFDIDGGRYTPEWTESVVLVSSERERAADGERAEDRAARKAKVGQGLLGLGASTPRLPQPGWQKVSADDIGLVDDKEGTIKLRRDVEIEGVFTTHQTDVFTKGKAELHFFPMGWAERAIIYLRERGKEGEVYSVEVDSLTGRAYVHSRRIPIPPEDLDDRGKEEEGESVF
jgi:general secretion pathway protein H